MPVPAGHLRNLAGLPQKFLHHDTQFEPGQKCGRAKINATTVEDVLGEVAVKPKLVGIAKEGFVTVDRVQTSVPNIERSRRNWGNFALDLPVAGTCMVPSIYSAD